MLISRVVAKVDSLPSSFGAAMTDFPQKQSDVTQVSNPPRIPTFPIGPTSTPWTGIWEDGISLLASPSYRAVNGWQGLVDGRYVLLAAAFPYSEPDASGIYYYPQDTPHRMRFFPLEGKQGNLRILKVESHLVTLRLEKDDSLVYFDLHAFQFTRDPNAKLPTATPYIPKWETPVPTSVDWLRTAIPYP